MNNHKQSIINKIEYLQNELYELKEYFYLPETYHYLTARLDDQQVLLKEIEVVERFAAIDMEAEEDSGET